MTLDQALAFAIVGGMMALFVWGRLRYDLVAMLALLAAVAVGIVPPDRAFSGFGDDIVIIAGFVKNVGALAILMPVAFQLARRTGTSPSCLLMPLAFGSLLGGLMTLVGTSPNVLVSRLRADLLGEPFEMFDFTPVGAGLALAGVVFLTLGYRLLPAGRRRVPSMDAAFTLGGYTTEAHLGTGSPLIGKTVADLEALGEQEVRVTTIVRERFRRYTPAEHWVLAEDDVLLLEGEPASLERVVSRGRLRRHRRSVDRRPTGVRLPGPYSRPNCLVAR